MKKLISAVVAAAALSSLGGFAQADVVLEDKAYIVPSGEVSQICMDEPLPSIGGNCFNVEGDAAVHVEVLDAVNLDAASFDVRFYGDAGILTPRMPGCNSGSFDVPEGAKLMRVFIGITNAPNNCETSILATPSVGGSIYVTHLQSQVAR